jgi:hypothetical protein
LARKRRELHAESTDDGGDGGGIHGFRRVHGWWGERSDDDNDPDRCGSIVDPTALRGLDGTTPDGRGGGCAVGGGGMRGATDVEAEAGRGWGRGEGATDGEMAACGGRGLAAGHGDDIDNNRDNVVRLYGEGVEDDGGDGLALGFSGDGRWQRQRRRRQRRARRGGCVGKKEENGRMGPGGPTRG